MGEVPYRRGREKEYAALRLLRKEGWKCCRTAASHSPVDIFAGKKGEILLIQVKSEKSHLGKEELKRLKEWAKSYNAKTEVWYFSKEGIKKVEIWKPEDY